MSRATVRAALVTFFNNTSIQGLGQVHSAPPYWADGSEWDLARPIGDGPAGAGAIGAIHLAEDVESRVSVPAIQGWKAVTYKAALMVFYQWLLPSNTLTPVDEAAWADPLDGILDGLVALIRSDPNLGDPTVIWQAGQSANDVHVICDVPRRLPGKVLSWNVIEFDVIEMVQA